MEIEVNFVPEQETAWLSLDQISELFDRDKSVISRHISNILKDGELSRAEAVAKNAMTARHEAMSGKTQTHMVDFYNLDVIISIGYRVKSVRGTAFLRLFIRMSLEQKSIQASKRKLLTFCIS